MSESDRRPPALCGQRSQALQCKASAFPSGRIESARLFRQLWEGGAKGATGPASVIVGDVGGDRQRFRLPLLFRKIPKIGDRQRYGETGLHNLDGPAIDCGKACSPGLVAPQYLPPLAQAKAS